MRFAFRDEQIGSLYPAWVGVKEADPLCEDMISLSTACEHIEQRFSQDRGADVWKGLGQLMPKHPHSGQPGAAAGHTKTHTGNFLNAKDDFSCQTCGERWESSSESDRVSTQATVGGLSGDVCGLCHPGLFPVERRDRKWSGILGAYKASSVCQTTIRHQIQVRGDSEPSDGTGVKAEGRICVFR